MTAHIEANKEDIASIVIMPGDPMRAKFIAENYLDNYKLINKVRGMLGYTGYYKDTKITVLASGMGIPSMGIYSYELYKFYDVEKIIRIGSCGSYTKDLDLYDLILVNESFSTSNYAFDLYKNQNDIVEPSESLTHTLENKLLETNKKYKKGRIHSTDVFYSDEDIFNEMYEEKNCLGVEMETFSLFHNAKLLNKEAACILTVSDNLITKTQTTPEEREKNFTEMILITLDALGGNI